MPYKNVDISLVLNEIGRIRECVEAARAFAEPKTLPDHNDDELRESCEELLVHIKWHLIDPLWEYINSCFVADEETKADEK